MDLKFSEMAVDTTLAQQYFEKNRLLLELYNDHDGTIDKYDKDGHGSVKIPKEKPKLSKKLEDVDQQNRFRSMASKLKQNANLIAQLEYHTRNIPIEETHAQLNLIIQYFRCYSYPSRNILISEKFCFRPDNSLLKVGYLLSMLLGRGSTWVDSKELVAISHLFINLLCEAGADARLYISKKPHVCGTSFIELEELSVKGLDSGTVAVVSDDADVDSAVDKFVSVSKQAPWRLRTILVQESVYQQFKDALTWKSKLNQSGAKPLVSNVLCSNTLTYNDVTFLIDPVGLTEEQPSMVTVEAYRTTKEMISLVQQHKPRYLSLWINGVAEINKVTHSTKAPVVWVNNVADFRGPPQVSQAVYSYLNDDINYITHIRKCDKVAKLCELSQSWLKLDFESRRDILCEVLDKYIALNPAKKLYTDIRDSLSSFTQKSFVDVGKDYVCTGMLQPKGIKASFDESALFSVTGFESILQGNALITYDKKSLQLYSELEQVGVPVMHVDEYEIGNFEVSFWNPSYLMRTRVIWTNSGTIFAN